VVAEATGRNSYFNLTRRSFLFRGVNKGDRLTGDSLTSQGVWRCVKTYAKLAHKGGAKLDQIQLSLGHASLTILRPHKCASRVWSRSGLWS
jgi:hypothetical protein